MSIEPSSQPLPKPLEYTFAGIFGICLIWDAFSFCSSQKKYCDLSKQVKTNPSLLQKKKEANEERTKDAVSLGRTTAQTLCFGHSVKWINLAKAAGPVSGIVSLATLFLSGLKIKQAHKEAGEASSKSDKMQKAHALLLLAEHVCYVAWAAIEIVSLVLGVAFCPILSGLLLIGSLAACTANIILEDQIKEKNKKLPAKLELKTA